MLSAYPTAAFLDILADAITTEAGTDLVAGLFTNEPDLGPGTLIRDLDAPTYTGYALVPLTVGTRRGNANGDIIIPLGTATFQPTNNTNLPQTVKGVYLALDGTPDVLWLAEMLDTPYQFLTSASALDIILEIYVRADQLYGMVCTTCEA